ncbi:MAG: D-glycerate dehydrogenase [Proteobacteria bacterium]|nr:D-glycerate dehydrogenase [Pseudomonadota bacterium]MDA1357552.1 D-glycerate dehydrogenase [Pseudomonadota bacterium]
MANKPVLLITRDMPPLVEVRATASYAARLNRDDKVYDADGLIAAAKGADAMLVCGTERLPREMVERLPDSVKIVACFTAGYEHVDLAAAEERGIVVTHAPDALTDAVADITLLLLLGAARRAGEGEAIMRSGGWIDKHLLAMTGSEISGKRLGILGMGRIGRAVATRAHAFGLEIHYHNRSRLAADLEAGAIWHENAESLLECSDFLSLHCPSNEESRSFLNEQRISRLPEGAIIINTSRGDVVDDAALIAALESGRVRAAGLDVYRGEPHNINPGYARLANTFLLPHIGSATVSARSGMGLQALDNLDAYFAGKPPPNRLV